MTMKIIFGKKHPVLLRLNKQKFVGPKLLLSHRSDKSQLSKFACNATHFKHLLVKLWVYFFL